MTFPSLRRHVENAEGDVIRFVPEPALTAEELHETLVVIGLAVLACTFNVVRHLPNGDAVVGQFLGPKSSFKPSSGWRNGESTVRLSNQAISDRAAPIAQGTALRVTYDSNAWESVFDMTTANYRSLCEAMTPGAIEGFICEAAFRIEAITKQARSRYFAQPRTDFLFGT